ncbi:MAG TPA: PilZ domain-containing protein [Bryobacteraceae bacterium]|nr:PilZ domain-containing protein [Bryobacteraceae bacterium]
MLVVVPPDGDRRRELRFKVERPCRVYPADAGLQKVDGVIEDISRTGIRIFLPDSRMSQRWPKVGDAALIVLDLPQSKKYAPRCLECAGRVVRVGNALADWSSFAFEIERVRVRSNGKRKCDKSVELLEMNPTARTQ